MRSVYQGLYVSSRRDCFTGNDNWAVVHACGGYCLDNYKFTVLEVGKNLYLNMKDRDTPHFVRSMFKRFLEFAFSYWSNGYNILVHCYAGESRSPSLALLFLAKSLKVIPGDCFEIARFEYELMDPGYFPGRGIENYLRNNWDVI